MTSRILKFGKRTILKGPRTKEDQFSLSINARIVYKGTVISKKAKEALFVRE
jgi:hypothetical protein